MHAFKTIVALLLFFSTGFNSQTPQQNKSSGDTTKLGLLEIKGKFFSCDNVHELSPIEVTEESICSTTPLGRLEPEEIGSMDTHESHQDLIHFFGLYDKQAELKDTLRQPIASGLFDVYSKMDYTVFGTAYQCSKIMTVIVKTTALFGGHTTDSYEIGVSMEKADCDLMISSRICKSNVGENDDINGKMTCNENNYCEYESLKKIDYPWWGDVTHKRIKCATFPREVMANNVDAHMFGSHMGCQPGDLFCRLSLGQVVTWDKDLIHQCPFRRIANYSQALLKYSSILVVMFPIKKWAFRPIAIEQHCGKTVARTSEGLYLVSGRDSKNFYSKTNVKEEAVIKSEKTLTDLLLADEDFRNVQIEEDIGIMFEKQCQNFMSLLRLFALSEDRYWVTADYKKNDMVLYTKNGHIYQPKCVQVHTVYINEKTSITESTKCSRDLPVTFIEPGQVFAVNKFLNNQGILRDDSPVIDCPVITEYTGITGNSIAIGRLGQKISVVQKKVVFRHDLRFFRSLVNVSLDHSALLTKGVDILGDFLKIKQRNEFGQNHVLGTNTHNSEPDDSILHKGEMSVINWIKDVISAGKLALILIGLVTLIAVGIYTWQCLKGNTKCRNKFKRQYKRAPTTAATSIPATSTV